MNDTRSDSLDTKVVTLRDLWSIFVQRLWIICLVAAVCVAVLFAYGKIAVAPQYSSTATLYILHQEGEEISSSDFSLALNVVSDCDYLLKSHSVLDQVIDSLELDMTYEELYRNVTTSNPDGTRILEVTVTADTPQQAKQIVDSLCLIGPEKVNEAMGFRQVNLYEYGLEDQRRVNGFGLIHYFLAAAVTGMLTYAVFVVMFLLDDRIHSVEDIERQLGLSILGEIPDAENPGKQGSYGYYRRTPKAKDQAREDEA